jgi:sugar lactone lactonase YvrE
MRRVLLTLTTLMLALLVVQPSAAGEPFPDIIPLPDGFRPEGIEIGRGTTFFAGSIPTGAIYQGDLRTGTGALLVQPVTGRSAIGLGIDSTGSLLFVAGGATGQGYVYDAQTGAEVAVFQLTSEASTFVNDVVVTGEAAYFTDSRQPVLYRVALDPVQGVAATVETIPLGGDFIFVPGVTNLNGIDATPNGTQLIVVNSATGTLYTVDPDTGVAGLIDLGGDTLPNGDGILVDGKTLYVVQNRLNQIAVVELSPDRTRGAVVDVLTDADFDVPTTLAAHGRRLYAVNARFGTPPTPETTYDVVQVSKH